MGILNIVYTEDTELEHCDARISSRRTNSLKIKNETFYRFNIQLPAAYLDFESISFDQQPQGTPSVIDTKHMLLSSSVYSTCCYVTKNMFNCVFIFQMLLLYIKHNAKLCCLCSKCCLVINNMLNSVVYSLDVVYVLPPDKIRWYLMCHMTCDDDVTLCPIEKGKAPLQLSSSGKRPVGSVYRPHRHRRFLRKFCMVVTCQVTVIASTEPPSWSKDAYNGYHGNDEHHHYDDG